MTPSLSEEKGNSTPVYFILNHDLQEFQREMNDLMSKWKMFPACWTLDVKDYYGKSIRYKGITYDGSPRDVYWEYFDPFIKNGIIKIIDKFRDVYEEKGIDVSVAKNEIGDEFYRFIERFYQKLAVIDQGLIKQSKRDTSPHGVYGLRDVSGMILIMKQFIDRQVEARFHQKKPKKRWPSWLKWIVGIVSGGGLAVTLSLTIQHVKINGGDYNAGNKYVLGDEVHGDKNERYSENAVSDSKKKNIAKLKIKRLFEDYEPSVETTLKGFFTESQVLSSDLSRRNVADSGGHIKAQMDLAVKTKVKLEHMLQQLERSIEDVLVEGFGKETLSAFAGDFQAEDKRLEQAKSRLLEINKTLSESCKSLEVRISNKMNLTKNFDLSEDKNLS